MATAPDLLATMPEVAIRPMIEIDVADGRGASSARLSVPVERGHLPRLPARGLHLPRRRRSARQIIGYGVMSIGAGEAHILNLCVRDEFRCRGFGKRLLGYLLERARRCGHGRGIPRSAADEHRRDPALSVAGLRAGGHPARVLPGRRWARRCHRAEAGAATSAQSARLNRGATERLHRRGPV